MGLWDPYKGKLMEFKGKGHSILETNKAWAHQVYEEYRAKTEESAIRAKDSVREKYNEVKDSAKEQYAEIRPEVFNYWHTAESYRKQFISDTPLATRMTMYIGTTGLTLLLTGGILKRLKRTLFTSVVVGVLIVPEVVNPFNKT